MAHGAAAAAPAAHGTGHAEVLGTLAQEAGQLLDVLSVRLARMRAEHRNPASDHGAGPAASHPADEHPAGDQPANEQPPAGRPAADQPAAGAAAGHPTDATACLAWCPVCRGAELLRGDRPELAEKLLDTAAVIVGTLRSLISQPGEQPEPAPAPQPGTERIDIR